MEITPDIHPTANIKVVGVGGGGGNAVNRMIKAGIGNVEFIAINTDAQALHYNQAKIKVHIGRDSTKGLGTGGIIEVGKRAIEENMADVKAVLEGADMVFLTCGLGGGTGSSVLPEVAKLAKEEIGALTVAVVTKPFSFEGQHRMKVANSAYKELAEHVDTLITIPNDRLLNMIDKKTTLLDAFTVVDDVLLQGIQGISDLITQHGHVNVDFADAKAIMRNAGSALMGIGYAGGENRATEAAKSAIESPLLDMSIDGAKGIIVIITGGRDLSMWEIDEAAKTVTASADPEANVIFGAVIDDNMSGEIKVTVIATGFESKEDVLPIRRSFMQKNSPAPVKPAINFFGSDFKNNNPGSTASTTSSAKVNNASSTPTGSTATGPSTPQDELEVPTFIRKRMI
ncbi:MAG: cell division protein FtsZ [Candidatus Abawacabacteria bacterium RIFCSPHIGHO2_01_FULL_46_8]|uniref:Cell division protein FtsZ n=1 Tax=Candidatus Abawacabacteria bacterium RIFCSPHIGHO2_01_FULL_46_8 TaxID=1817815 RepID=A0A1F4XM10_9BACT|nr:MAG: cell division protein FtsZ [Candidatus Abawacabacteria bacterium RIFCSPHIGHO2_01_FULL_46_8]